jgi:hypothetical protein
MAFFNCIRYVASNRRLIVVNELDVIWKEAAVVCLEGLRKIVNTSKDSGFSGRDSKHRTKQECKPPSHDFRNR